MINCASSLVEEMRGENVVPPNDQKYADGAYTIDVKKMPLYSAGNWSPLLEGGGSARAAQTV